MIKPVIICVDDEKILLDNLKEQLNFKFGGSYDIEIAETGSEALRLFRELLQNNVQIPLVITDYLMPGMKGDDLLKELCEIEPNVVTVLLTGQATIAGVANAVNHAGVFRYIAKPWDVEELYSIVAEALQHYYEDRLFEEKVVKLKNINSELRQSLTDKTRELEYNRQVLESDNPDVSSGQPREAVSQRLYNILFTIKSGIDVIYTQKTNPPADAGTSALDICSINEFYQITSGILGNLIEVFDRNAINLPVKHTDNEISKIVNDQISMANRNLAGSLQELTRRVNMMERQFAGSIDRIAAWDDEEIVILDLREVLFFTSEDGQSYGVTRKVRYKMRETLDNLETKFNHRNFFRCHRSFIVNLKHISKICPWFGNNSYITKFTGSEYEIPISRNRIKEMKKLLEIE